MVIKYYYHNDSKLYTQAEIVSLLKDDFVKEKAGCIQSVSGDFFLSDITFYYCFDRQHKFQVDYAFSDAVPLSTRIFWEKLMHTLTA
ncbi:hypothetical protein [Liquorilactobacillus satsumensis]|uniref:Uncharacterized protein n=1 Tax=Liquorilactobacillus satsumensis DSM 16230 = JCM 12392 TaxID=1423801 RepID=A0A0R1V3Y4_9LACO|nr:hypothetical protein [Liquorilactobacillus satsumensis]KRM00296.1 hypothetical protein FD50_GL001555 [Liquorilactobacillus satsumensis DSM 16230 = JCM 12392]MCC7666409.1 hypothetical protein [Liquorilactobacillus satsumensis]MCP9313011.1 hypothetical protein [Liquorilactobacillus satsumensis]MCP9328957.1 hypothetical protein [Liquorilactobacillus satsumensis]MCP9357666.1 hypothetical protein [Liquorilactobacillus satsumensis]